MYLALPINGKILLFKSNSASLCSLVDTSSQVGKLWYLLKSFSPNKKNFKGVANFWISVFVVDVTINEGKITWDCLLGQYFSKVFR